MSEEQNNYYRRRFPTPRERSQRRKQLDEVRATWKEAFGDDWKNAVLEEARKAHRQDDFSRGYSLEGLIEDTDDEHRSYRKRDVFLGVEAFGVWYLHIRDAAELIAIDMYYAGNVELNEPEQGFKGECDPNLLAALSDNVRDIEGKLVAAVDRGTLKSLERRTLNETVVPEGTYVKYGDLEEWLSVRGYHPGEVMREWEETTEDMAYSFCSDVCEELDHLPALRQNGRVDFDALGFNKMEEADREKTFKATIRENEQLKHQLARVQLGRDAKVDRPLSTSPRRTLLTMIAALCREAGIDVANRGAAQRIVVLTENLGAPISEDTIRNFLREIPDAIEGRTK